MAWMQSTLNTIGDRQLRSIAMPGSHDAGMSVIEGKTGFVTEEDVVMCQTGIRGVLWPGPTDVRDDRRRGRPEPAQATRCPAQQ